MMQELQGKIIKGIGGFYYVKTDKGVIECRARGKFRNDSICPYVGDNVIISVEQDSGYLTKILERKNSFIRPPIANIDRLIIVSSIQDPKPDTIFIDKLIITALLNNTEVAICFNKSDLQSDYISYKNMYEKAGIKVFITSALNNEGIDDLRNFMKDSVNAVCGFSGVGKSSILNRLTNSDFFATGEISAKLNRGKHTTRHVELYELDNNSYLADTPGFSMLNLETLISREELINYYEEFKPFIKNCKFSDCTHVNASGCSLINALNDGVISPERYDNYVYLYKLLKSNKEWKK